jgi:predicted nucleic acid-binding protein
MYLVDTNVISEARKGSKANPGVREFWRGTAPTAIYLAVQTVGEIRAGLERVRARGDLAQARLLAAWLEVVVADYADRIVDFDLDCAQVWGNLMAFAPQHPIDKQIAAMALIHDLTVVTRNVDDFAGSGVRLLNPFH